MMRVETSHQNSVRNRQVESSQPATAGTDPKVNGDWLRWQLQTLPAGATLTIPPGDYEGPFVVDKPNISIQVANGGKARLFAAKGRTSQLPDSLADAATLIVKGENFKGSNLIIENNFQRVLNDPATHVPNPAVCLENGGELQNCDLVGFQDTLYAKGGTTIIRGGSIYGCVDAICNGEPSTINLEGTTINFLKNIDESWGGDFLAPKGKIDLKRCRVNANIPEQYREKYSLGRPWPSATGFATTGSARYEDCTLPFWLMYREMPFNAACYAPEQQGKYEIVGSHPHHD